MPFQKGQSGNPGGRPKGDGRIREMALKMCPEMIEILANIARNSESESARVTAANVILDRGLGKAVQAIAGGDGEGPIEFIHRIERVIVESPSNPNSEGISPAA